MRKICVILGEPVLVLAGRGRVTEKVDGLSHFTCNSLRHSLPYLFPVLFIMAARIKSESKSVQKSLFKFFKRPDPPEMSSAELLKPIILGLLFSCVDIAEKRKKARHGAVANDLSKKSMAVH